jgi:hypothetical protein
MSNTIPLKSVIGKGGIKIVNNLAPVYGKALGAGGKTLDYSGATNIVLTGSTTRAVGMIYNTSTGAFTIPTTGLYKVSCLFPLVVATGAYIEVLVNGSFLSSTEGRLAQTGGGNALGVLMGSNIYPLKAGQTFGLQFVSNQAASFQNNPQDTFWFIRKVA